MKIFKKVLIGIAVLLLIPFVTALFVKKDYQVEREILVNKPKLEVFNYLKFLKNQDYFSRWANMDHEMEKTYRGTDGEPGFVSAWNSSNPDVGKGEQEIINIVDGERIDYELRFFEPFESTEKAWLATDSVSSSQTLVTWGFKGRMNYPMNLMLLFIDFEKMVGMDFESGLTNLKNLLEKQEVL